MIRCGVTVAADSSMAFLTMSGSLHRRGGCIRAGLLMCFLVIGRAMAEESAFQCIEQITMPVYGGLVWQAQVTGRATAQIVLTDGKPEIRVQSSDRVLAAWVTGALRAATFRTECRNRIVHLEFQYELRGKRREAPDNQVSVKYPGTILITASPPVLHPSID